MRSPMHEPADVLFAKRLGNAFFESTRRLLLETTLAFRLSVIMMLILLTAFVGWQVRRDIVLEQSIQKEALRLEAITIDTC